MLTGENAEKCALSLSLSFSFRSKLKTFGGRNVPLSPVVAPLSAVFAEFSPHSEFKRSHPEEVQAAHSLDTALSAVFFSLAQNAAEDVTGLPHLHQRPEFQKIIPSRNFISFSSLSFPPSSIFLLPRPGSGEDSPSYCRIGGPFAVSRGQEKGRALSPRGPQTNTLASLTLGSRKPN